MALPDLLQGVPLVDLDQDAVDAASARVRTVCDWHIAPQVEETVTVFANHHRYHSQEHHHYGCEVLLPTLRLVSVSSVLSNGLPVDGFTWTQAGRLHLPYCPSHRLPVVVTFTHGYETCPADVRAVVAQIASRGLVPAAQIRSETVGPFTAAYYQNSEPLDSIHSYRRLSVA